jgi:hypothetical protein
VSTGIVHVWYRTVMRLAQCAAGKNMCSGKTGGLLHAMKKEDLVGRRDYQNTTLYELHMLLVFNTAVCSTYLELGRGTGETFGACFSGL